MAIDDSEAGQPVGCGHCGSITIVPQSRFSQNALINDFVIRSTLGSGGMGTVYLAHQLSLDRPVALKILMEQFAHNSEFIVDFVREARAAARLNHPNIVQSYAVGEDDGIYFFAMEYVEGKTLKDMLSEEKKLSWERAFTIVQQIAEALDFAWKNQQLVHRDIKPDNIMMTKRGVAKLADLGLARAAHETMEDDDEVMGTPQYICPEQLLGQPMDVRGDIYSLGATLFHALTGNFPFEGDSAAEIARKHLNAPVPDPCEMVPSIPKSAGYVVKRMMAKRLEDRYEDAEELVVDIGYVLRGQNPVGFKAKNPAKKTHRGTNTKSGKLKKSRSKGNITKTGIKGTKKGTGVYKAPSSPAPSRNTSSNPPVPPKPPQPPNSGDSTMTKSSTGQVKSKSLKSTRLSKSGTQTGTNLGSKTQSGTQTSTGHTSSYRRPGTPAPKAKSSGSSKAIVAILLVVVFALIGVITLFIITYVKYDFKAEAAAKAEYLDNCATQAERSDYLTLEGYFTSPYDDSEAEEKLKRANEFLEKYPNSLFSLQPGQKLSPEQWAKLYKVPFEITMISQNIPKRASGLVGRLRYYRNEVFRPRYLIQVRQQRIDEEDKVIAFNEAKYKFDQTKEEVWGEIDRVAAEVIGQYRKRKDELTRQLSQSESKYSEEKNTVITDLIQKTTNFNFEQALIYLNEQLDKSTVDKKYPVRVAPRAIGYAGEPPIEKAKSALGELYLKFTNIPKEVHGQVVHNMSQDTINTAFDTAINSNNINVVLDELRALPGKERDLFSKRSQWLNNHKKSVQLAKKYNDLVADTGTFFGESWDQRKSIDNYRNIGKYLRGYGWFPRTTEERPGDQVWIQATTKNKFVLQVRRYHGDGSVLPVGTEDLPHWEAVCTRIFEYCAKYRKKDLAQFDEAKACHEFYIRPSMFQDLIEQGVSGGNISFLQNEIQLALRVWNPEWAKDYMDRMLKSIQRASGAERKKFLKDHIEKILGPTKAYSDRRAEFEAAAGG